MASSLGPLVERSDVSNVKILAGDDQRYTFPWWFQDMEATDPKSLEYLYGFAVHFYVDTYNPPSLLDDTKRLYPKKVILNTEACLGTHDNEDFGPILGSWDRAQSYILSYIEVYLL